MCAGERKTMKPVLKYPGAKQGISSWIIGHFPPHKSYLEPYMGSLAILLNKGRSPIETVNDLDDEVVNLFTLLRDNPEPVMRAVALTPYAREEYSRAYQGTVRDPVEKARRFLVSTWQSFGFRQNFYKVGWKRDIAGREAAYAARHWAALPQSIAQVVERLQGVQIEQQDAVELIQAYNNPDVLIYADPPYVLSTRHGKNYRHEMTDNDHVQLLEALKNHKGPVVLSGYDCPLYREHLQGWQTDSIQTYASHAKPRTETIWMNFEQQPTLYDLAVEQNDL